MSLDSQDLSAVSAVLAAILPRAAESDLSPDTALGDLGWDSLSSLEAFTAIEEREGVRLDLSEFHRARTVGDLATQLSCSRSKAEVGP